MEDTMAESDSHKKGTEEALENEEEIASSAQESAKDKHDDISESPLLTELDLDQEPTIEDKEESRTEKEQPSPAQEPTVGEEHPRIDHEVSTAERGALNINQETILTEQDPALTDEECLTTNQEPTVEELKNLTIDQESSLGEQEHMSTDLESMDQKQTVRGQLDPSAYQESTLGEAERPSAGQEPIVEAQQHSSVQYEMVNKMKQKNSDNNDGLAIPTSLDHQTLATTPVISNATATVKIMLVPHGHVITMAFAISCTAGNLKEHFASKLKIPRTVIQFMFEGRKVNDTETLMDLGVRPHGTIQLEMLSVDSGNYPIKPVQQLQDYNMPDVIMVRVQTDTDTFQDVVVEIERLACHKPYLGGYRHKVTGVEFHNAGTQTFPKRYPNRRTEMFCRDAQTVFEKNRYQQCTNTTSTQMTKIGCYVSNLTDKLIKPGKYVTAAEYHARRLKAVLVIQTYFRQFHAKKIVQQLRLQKMQRMEWELKEELRRKKEREDRMKSEYERRMNPKTREDFELLFHILELWRLEELDRIDRTYTGAERKAALCALLEQEAQFIAAIGRHRHDADEGNQQLAIRCFLNKCSEPKRWKAFDGKCTEMYTPYTIRAQHLQDIYNTLNIKYLTLDERLDILLTLKHTMKEYDCRLTQDIIELIDREADLMMRGVKDCNLEGLRKRIATLFLEYIKTPLFNPEIVKVLKVPQNPVVLRKNVFYCLSCKNYLPSTDFPASANACTIERCRKCYRLDNEARRREDFSKYKCLLSHLQKSEADFTDDARIAFLLQEKDVQYLVELIWAAQSALSACSDLSDLVLVRWNKNIEWSPWNCILLTKDESTAHLKLHNPEKEYEFGFIQKIKFRHTLAKNYFKEILGMVPHLYKDVSDQISQKADLQTPSSLKSKIPEKDEPSVE
ncbi:IQ motif and ubiquitin-like domain-containing protein [Microcaecilia unicolor]|uniref:IQ and ubiquitin-like domain-containing protein n=1 Tax=Microcaecilia unicolor TaxID=1415580 RepID=A0A6P7YYZ1_9AMPH|nr:IQ and ubiquitin-like domain-containing protein [Microcaecilia unicolor]